MATESVDGIDAAFVSTCRSIRCFLPHFRELGRDDEEEISSMLEKINNCLFEIEAATVIWSTLKDKINKRNENDGD